MFKRKLSLYFIKKLYIVLLLFSEFIPTFSSSRFTENILHLEDIAKDNNISFLHWMQTKNTK